MSRYIRGNVDEDLDIATLAAKTLVGANFDEQLSESGIISSLVSTWTLIDWTQAADVGPLHVGIAHSDYSDAEIEAVIETAGSWDKGNAVEQELAKRMVRRIGTIAMKTAGGVGAVQSLNDGMPIKTKLNWRLTTGDTLKVWAYNSGAQPFATTSPDLRLHGHVNIFSD